MLLLFIQSVNDFKLCGDIYILKEFRVSYVKYEGIRLKFNLHKEHYVDISYYHAIQEKKINRL